MPAPRAARGALFGLVVLTGINLFNYIDRNVISGVEESVKDAFDLHDWQSAWGRLPSAFLASMGDWVPAGRRRSIRCPPARR